jgi:hypothetical protein
LPFATLVAGVDVGNSTTEVVVARMAPGAEPVWLFAARRVSSGPKGSLACVDAVAELLAQAERRLGSRPQLAVLSELHPVRTGLLELGRLQELALRHTAIARPGSDTPSGSGIGAGRLTRLAEMRGAPADGDVVAVVEREDFEAAAATLRDARERGWRIAAAVVQGDDGVLIGNRFDSSLPIVDEVADAPALPFGSLAAVEVAQDGASVTVLSDPLRLGLLLGFDPEEGRAARTAARAVAGCRTAIVVRTPPAPRSPSDDVAPVMLLGADGVQRPLDEHSDPPPPGRIVALRGAVGDVSGVIDVVWRQLPSPPDDPAFARTLARRHEVAIATLARGEVGDLLSAVSELCPGGARVVARESDAAMLGASTTPGAGRAPFVIDLGGGTVDLHCAAGVLATAGGGELVTRICSRLLGCDVELAERAKRHRSARVETPFTLHHEDGQRSFLGEPASPRALARLCALDGKQLVTLPGRLAPEVWRGLRRAAKREVLAWGVKRALDALGGVPRGELVLLIGGCAADQEVVDVVAGELEERDLAVARGNVLGRYGPRAGVAAGLVLAFSRGAGR